MAIIAVLIRAGSAAADADAPVRLSVPMVVTQLPVGLQAELSGTELGMLRADYGDGARLIVVEPDGSTRVLVPGFASVCDASLSFDARSILFAGKRRAEDPWNIYEVSVDGSGLRQITRDFGNCRSPCYQSTLYTIVSPEPWRQLTFVSDAAGQCNEAGQRLATSLYSCKLDGSSVRRLTYNLSADFDPYLMRDGRLLFSSWQRSRLDQGIRGRIGLFWVGLDGTDFARFTSDQGLPIKHMACVTADDVIVFVETNRSPWDGAGRLGSHSLRRPLQTYSPLTSDEDGLYHSPSPLSDGRLLVSCRPVNGDGSHAVYRFDPRTGKRELVFDDPQFHDIQAVAIEQRLVPDGRSSVVTEDDQTGKLYCLNVYQGDLQPSERLANGAVKRLRVLEGIPSRPSAEAGETQAHRIGPLLVKRRILGEIDVNHDGSFNVTIPAATPVELQTLDENGMALRSCGWIWAMNHEPRGCIGCHEDGELTPENRVVDALNHASVSLTLPPERRRTVDFRRDVLPIIEEKCVPCHNAGGAPPTLQAEPGSQTSPHPAYRALVTSGLPGAGQLESRPYVYPGAARKSPLIWHVFGRNASRPWDGDSATQVVVPIPANSAKPLTEDELRTFVEWIDMGALWDGIPDPAP